MRQLEIRPDRRQRDIEFEVLAGKITRELFADRLEIAVLSGHDVRLQALTQNSQFGFQRAAIGEFEQAQSFIVRDGEHRAERSVEPFGKHAAARLRGGGRVAENSGERFAKAARRFEAAPVFRFVHASALAHFAQGEAHPARAMIGLERHSVMTLELAARGRWIDGKRRQFLVRQTVRPERAPLQPAAARSAPAAARPDPSAGSANTGR